MCCGIHLSSTIEVLNINFHYLFSRQFVCTRRRITLIREDRASDVYWGVRFVLGEAEGQAEELRSTPGTSAEVISAVEAVTEAATLEVIVQRDAARNGTTPDYRNPFEQ